MKDILHESDLSSYFDCAFINKFLGKWGTPESEKFEKENCVSKHSVCDNFLP
jgi:hypothetical protein